MSFESTSLSGFSFTGLGGTFWPSSKTTDFRFFDIFIVKTERERRRKSGWGNRKEWNCRTDHLNEFSAQNVKTLFSFSDERNHWIRSISIDYPSIGRRVICMATTLSSSGSVQGDPSLLFLFLLPSLSSLAVAHPNLIVPCRVSQQFSTLAGGISETSLAVIRS